ncbi:hypothetical protein Desac_0978 [Desulfobacca acetoxidans DSM 11109]|uniref:Uncharacterized protein n=1 Tax=Desulfobacca acetoxidans (strain ATCC 700848 / DSM 11109 / ASRB2) TaxID=880072 RepID=F2NC50_DESAR|nr:hypothetical protein Desac_0978 [Desulfobacca acetoxidans DSM 11109]
MSERKCRLPQKKPNHQGVSGWLSVGGKKLANTELPEHLLRKTICGLRCSD